MSQQEHPYGAEIEKLLELMSESGMEIIDVDDGGDIVPVDKCPAIDTILSVDMSWIRARNKDGKKGAVLVVLGNEPGYSIADYSCSLEEPMDDILDVLTGLFDK